MFTCRVGLGFGVSRVQGPAYGCGVVLWLLLWLGLWLGLVSGVAVVDIHVRVEFRT